MSVDKGMANTAGGVFSLQANLSALLFNLQSGLDDEQRKWVLDAIAQLRQNIDGSELLANRLVSLTSMMKRRLGEQTVRLELPVFDSSGAGNDFVQVFSHWTRTDLGRIVLTGSALMAADTDPFELIRKVFAYSDNNEKRSLVLGLYWLLEDERLGGFLEDVQRVNALDIFTALALDNPLPARYYADAPFNQLVLKSLFQNLPIDRIVGLQERRNAELVRMCDDYLHERRLAGREIPASLWLALSCKDLSEETTLAWQSALMSASDDQRYYAAKALQYCRERGEKLPVALTEVLAEQSTRERHPAIKLLVQDMQS